MELNLPDRIVGLCPQPRRRLRRSRVRATFGAIENPSAYEYFTPCAATDAGGCQVRNMSAADWGWKRADLDGRPGGVAYFGPTQEAAAIAAGRLGAAAARMQPRDVRTGVAIDGVLSRGSVNWNAHRGRYVLVADRTSSDPSDGSSRFGEVRSRVARDRDPFLARVVGPMGGVSENREPSDGALCWSSLHARHVRRD